MAVEADGFELRSHFDRPRVLEQDHLGDWCQPCDEQLPTVEAVRRVDEREIGAIRPLLEIGEDVRADDPAAGCKVPDGGEVCLYRPQRPRVRLDEGDSRGTARQGLYPESPAAGEQVEHDRPLDEATSFEGVEHGLAHAVARRAQAGQVRRL